VVSLKRGEGKVYHALSHPVRRRIVELLEANGALSSSELKELLNIGPGKLYYHLQNLGGLIEQDRKRRYRLSEDGKEAYHLLVRSETLPVKKTTMEPPALEFIGNLRSILLFGWLLSKLYKDPIRHITESVILLFFGGWLCHVSGLQPIMLYYVNQNQTLYWSVAQFLAGWLVIYGTAELLCFVLFHRKGGNASLFVGTTFSLLPLLLFAVIWLLNGQFGWNLERLWSGWLIRSLLLLSQGWSLAILTVSVSKAKKLSLDRASLVGFAVAYLNIALLLVQKSI
jgi:DNA-binding transcriptional ArsR family regulator